MKTVLIAEDNEADLAVMKRACERTGLPHTLRFVSDGQQAMDYLSGIGDFADRERFPLPEIILLDISLPKRNGHEVLEWIRQRPVSSRIPVIILTMSSQISDIERAYQLGATSYLVKNSDLGVFNGGVETVLKYWLVMNTGP